jgi:hypothetical protein
MIDMELIGLVRNTQGRLRALGKDARQSEILAVKENFAMSVEAVLNRAAANISDAEKIAAFDKMLASQVAALQEEIASGGYRDDDADHYTYEEVVQLVFGGKIFDALNAFEKLLPRNG